MRHKILYAFEVAERILDPVQRRAWLTFVIVGAGPTGVELLAYAKDEKRGHLGSCFQKPRIGLGPIKNFEAGQKGAAR
jgi:NADH dehydrogenase FAD-containing subunit